MADGCFGDPRLFHNGQNQIQCKNDKSDPQTSGFPDPDDAKNDAGNEQPEIMEQSSIEPKTLISQKFIKVKNINCQL